MLRIVMLVTLLVPILGFPTLSWGQVGEAPCGKWLGGTTEEAERWLACQKAQEEVRRSQCDPNTPMTNAELGACAQREYERRMQRQQEQWRQEAERQRQMWLEERRVRALEEAAQAQRDAANAAANAASAANQPRTCKTVRFELGRPVIECYTPRYPGE